MIEALSSPFSRGAFTNVPLDLFSPIVSLSPSSRGSFFSAKTKACGMVQGTEQGPQAK